MKKYKKDIQINFINEYINSDKNIKKLCQNYNISIRTGYRILNYYKIDFIKKPRIKRTPKYSYLEGQTIGKLKIIKIIQEGLYDDGTYFAICECLNCGNKNYKIRPYDIIKGKSKACGCLKNYNPSLGKNNKCYKGYELIHKQKWSLWEIGARNRGIEFSIDMKYAYKIIEKQNFICNLSGMKIEFAKNNSKYPTSCSASLDRINSDLGYIEGNIQWVHKDINKIKWNFREAYFILLCKCIAYKNIDDINCINKINEEIREKEWNNILYNRTPYYNQLHICGNKNLRFTGYEEISGEFWSSIKIGAKVRCIDFSVSIQDIYEIFIKQDKKCSLSGINIWMNRTSKENKTASLDRINSDLGYVYGNIQWIHKDINKMKNDYEQNYFILLCKKVADYEKSNYK